MKILSVIQLAIADIKVIRFARFCDHRGYFSEQFRKSDLMDSAGISSLTNADFVQANESVSHANVVRGLHFQWNPYMGKLVRTVHGHMVDMVLDIRKGSSTFGKAVMYDMPSNANNDHDEWIWVPPGFAHGNFFLAESKIEYLCTGEYSQGCEAGISPVANDIDWSLCDPDLKRQFDQVMQQAVISEKDRDAQNLAEWQSQRESDQFVYSSLQQIGLSG